MSPFSPVVGYRFLIAPDEDESALTQLMLHEIDRICRRNHISGCSFLFVDPDWQAVLESRDLIGWQHQSYAWQNPGFKTFDDYLAVFNANQRRNIKRERHTMERLGIRIKALAGAEIPNEYFPLMYTFYARTNARYGPWGCKYLTRAFFEGLSDNYRERLVLMVAFNGRPADPPMGMSFLLTKGDQLYGRYWGSSATINHLHFNACYYRPIEWAIHRNIKRFDPGAGSPHKVRRGFVAVSNLSLHRFYDVRLERIMRMHIDEINRLEQNHIDELNEISPFAKSQVSG
jgi:predicted N-acyltransferase